MSDRIGPTWEVDQRAAGIFGLPFSVDGRTGALLFDPSMSDAACARVQAVLDAHDPTRLSPPPVPAVTGNQWAFALRDLGLAEAWLSAIPKCKASDQWRAGLIGRDTVLRADDPLLARIAANAGSDAGGKALVDPAAVFAKALTEPT